LKFEVLEQWFPAGIVALTAMQVMVPVGLFRGWRHG
jgi:hypothetical protein